MSTKWYYAVVAVLVVLIVVMYGFGSFRGEVVVVEHGFKNIPYIIGEWQGEDYSFDESIYKELRADENFSRMYTRADGQKINLYIGYYGTKRGGHPEHVPTGCYPGSGWGIDAIDPLSIASSDGAQEIVVNNLMAVKGESSENMLYWLQNFRGTVVNTGWKQNIEKMKTRLLYNRNDGAFIRITAPIRNTREETVAIEKSFAADLLPLLAEHWPKEEVRR